MGIIYIVNRRYASVSAGSNPREFKDLASFVFTPQKIEPGKGMMSEATFALANTLDMLFLIHIALADNGKYYFGYSLHLDDSWVSCNPAPHLNISKGSDSIFGCMAEAIEFVGRYSKYYGDPPDSRAVAVSKRALRDLNSLRLKQYTIFDFI